MQGNMSDIISVAIINYNGKKTLLKVIESLLNSKNINVDLYIFDDCSTDNGLKDIELKYPNIKIYKHPHNTRNPNVLRNFALKTINSKYIFITDNDIEFDENCLDILLSELQANHVNGTCSPRLMYLTDRKRTYFAGTKMHFIAAAIGPYRDEIVNHSNRSIEPNSGSGILLVDRDKALEVGGFDEDYGLAWGDDGEFYQRLLIRGYKCLYVPNAFGYHEYKPFSTERYYRASGQITNRLLFIFTHYSKRTIFLLLPVFLIYELAELVFMIFKGIPLLFFKGKIEFLKKFNLVRKKRKQIQSLRKVSDKDVLYSGKIYVSPALLNNRLLKSLDSLLSQLLNLYWKIISPFIP